MRFKLLLFSTIFLNLNLLLSITIQGKLIDIDDGDTFTLMTSDHTAYKLRLKGVDCPEKGQDYAKVAKQFTYDFCNGKIVTANLCNLDKYGRHIADVFANNQSLNQFLVSNGLAWHYKKYSDDKLLAQLEKNARAARINIWSLNNRMSPWDYWHRGALQTLAPLRPGNVYTCMSEGAKTYHNKMCSGFSKCSKTIEQMSIVRAQSMGRHACGYCW
jgi:endonuclease YncB( thermonuclease family)